MHPAKVKTLPPKHQGESGGSCRAASEKIRRENFKNYILLFYGNRKKM